MTLESLGTISPHPAFRTSTYIYPVGYRYVVESLFLAAELAWLYMVSQ